MKNKKVLTTLACLGVATLSAIGLVGCGEKTEELWKADFSKGNNGVFASVNVTDNEDGSITLNDKSSLGQTSDNYTYFGEQDKNFDWKEGGMTVSLKMRVEGNKMQNGDHIVWSLALNYTETEAYLTEAPVFLVKNDDTVKFVYSFASVDDYRTVTNSESAVVVEDGTYEINYIFTEKQNNEVFLQVTLENEDGEEVYKSEDEGLKITDLVNVPGTDYTYDTIITTDMVQGLRYLWLTRNNVPVTVEGLTITK